MTNSVRTDWTIDSIVEFLHANRAKLRAFGVQKIGVFGSYVRGEAKPDSDIDLLFTMDHLTFSRWMDVWNFLEDAFNRRVDLVPEKNLREVLRSQVLAEARYVEDL